VTPKIDGASLYLRYVDGELALASSRGNSYEGELITRNVVKMQGVPLKLPEPLSFGVRGEIVIHKDVFEKHFKAADYKNPRNAASGCSRQHDGAMCEHLSLIVYKTYGLKFKKTSEELEFLRSMGFTIVDYRQFKSIEECVGYRNEFAEKQRDIYSVEVDGLVFANNDLAEQEKHGYSNQGRNLRAAIAYKFENEGGITTIEDVFFSCGAGGRITPNAVLAPVNIAGIEIKRATLHNPAYIRNLGIRIGSTVLVERANDVIPAVVECLDEGAHDIILPFYCPSCNTKLVMHGENLHCPNRDGCRDQVVGLLRLWVKNLDIKEWGEALIERLVDACKLKTVADLYTLSKDDLMSMDRMGEKSADKCLRNLHANTAISLDNFVGSLGIPMVGRGTVKIARKAGFDTLDKLTRASVEELAAIDGFGQIKAEAFVNGLKANMSIMNGLLDNGVSIMAAEKIEVKTVVSGGKLAGKSFVLTGTMSIKRENIVAMIEAAGGYVQNAVNKDTNFLVIADPQSKTVKANKARAMGITLIGEQELNGMIYNDV
jgi:DNA ligase (NAD+)